MKRLVAPLLALLALAPTAGATWSILLVDHATGEVGIASATCIANFALEDFLPVVVVGKGAGAAQSAVDAGANNRSIMFSMLMQDATPDQILDALLTIGDSPNSRQYGIVAFSGPSATFSGGVVGEGIGNVIGQVGTISYAIQGNVLTGPEVVFAAEEAVVDTDGDLGQRLLAGMQAAKMLGGDGRCSCSASDPTGCGVPPPSFTYSAHAGFVYVARIGDTDGTCTGAAGCANGDYYLQLAYSGGTSDPDPVDALQSQYDAWRAGESGRPDGVLSTAALSAESLPADGRTSARVTVRLVDVDGVPLASGGAAIGVSLSATSDATDVTLGPVTDNGDGSYAFDVVAGAVPGTAELVITADDGTERATLYPYPTLRVDSLTELHVGFDTVDAFTGATVPLTLNASAAAGGQYLVLASLSGTSPGLSFGGLTLPLNLDDVLLLTFRNSNIPPLVATLGALDGTGHADAAFAPGPNLLVPAIGLRVDWAALTWSGAVLAATNAAGFDVGGG